MHYLLIFLIAFVLSLLITPCAKFLSYQLKILDNPNYRKIHTKPIPLLGGVAIYISFTLALYFSNISFKHFIGISCIGLVFVFFGLLDDVGIKIRARYKIWGHLVFSFTFIYLTGVSLNFFQSHVLNSLLSACFITFVTNSMNMLDGMDGLVAGISFFASLFFFCLAIGNHFQELAFISLSVAGASLGFLRYNFNPASIFLGEAGATFIGFILAFIAIKFNFIRLWDVALILNIPRLQFISFIIPLIILGIPIFDTFFVFINRFAHRIKMSTPGKDHSHHRIQLMGLSQRMTVLFLYAVQVILGLIAMAMVGSNFLQFISLMLIVAVLAFSWCVFLCRVKVYA